jgi:hypothetical protein
LLYNILSTYDWSSVSETTAVDTAVASLNAAVRCVMEQEIPRDYSCKSNFPPGSPTPQGTTTLRKTISTVAVKGNLPITFTSDSPFTGNFLKAPSSPTGLDG